MEARLVVVGGKANKSEVRLKLPAMIGRSRDADITVSHASVSRHHCLIYELEGALVVRDNGSLNGTVVEGQKIQEALLRPGQSLTIGPLTFRAEYNHNGSFPTIGGPAEANGQAHPSGLLSAAATQAPSIAQVTPAAEEDESLSTVSASPRSDLNSVVGRSSRPSGQNDGLAGRPTGTPAQNDGLEGRPTGMPAAEEPPVAQADSDAFGFLSEEADEPGGTSSNPSFGFLAGDDVEDAAEADEAPSLADAASLPDLDEGTAQTAAAVEEEELPDVHLAPEPAAAEADSGSFGFLSEEADEPGDTSSKPSFSFLAGGNSDEAAADEDDSGAIFRLADDPPPAASPKEKSPAARKGIAAPADSAPADSSPADSSPANGAAAKAPPKENDDAALNDFLNSLGLEE